VKGGAPSSGNGTSAARRAGRNAARKAVLVGPLVVLLLIPVARAADTSDPTNLFGNRGLIGTPSARMAPDGELSVGASFLKNNQHYVRYRVLAKWKPKTLACFVLFVTSLVAVIATDLWPLLVPLGVFFFLVLRARWTLPRAISQLAVDCGEGLGMTRVPEP